MLSIQHRRTLLRAPNQILRRAVDPEQGDRVSRGRWPWPELMVECQPIGADGIAEVNS